jgi:hypothetical protein
MDINSISAGFQLGRAFERVNSRRAARLRIAVGHSLQLLMVWHREARSILAEQTSTTRFLGVARAGELRQLLRRAVDDYDDVVMQISAIDTMLEIAGVHDVLDATMPEMGFGPSNWSEMVETHLARMRNLIDPRPEEESELAGGPQAQSFGWGYKWENSRTVFRSVLSAGNPFRRVLPVLRGRLSWERARSIWPALNGWGQVVWGGVVTAVDIAGAAAAGIHVSPVIGTTLWVGMFRSLEYGYKRLQDGVAVIEAARG